MTKEDLRLKCLELAVSKTAHFAESLERAKAYEKWVLEEEVDTKMAQAEIVPRGANKPAGNGKILP